MFNLNDVVEFSLHSVTQLQQVLARLANCAQQEGGRYAL
jgi:hypothetical protein